MGNLVFQATLGGQVNLVGPNTASTFNLNVPAVSSTLATLTGTETFTNKTLTSPTLTTPVLGTPASGTLTNCTGLPNAGLVNSSVTVGSTSIALGASATTVAGLTSLATNTLTSAASTALTLQSAGTTAIYVDTSQNVGIGNTSPASSGGKLVVTPTNTTGSSSYLTFDCTNFIDSNFQVNITGSASTDKRAVVGTTTTTALALQTNGSERMRIVSGGNVGIGTTNPATKLEINPPTLSGTIQEVLKITDNTNSTLAVRQTTTVNDINGNHVLSLSTGGTERMRISSSGDVTIGDTTSYGKFAVRGYSGTVSGYNKVAHFGDGVSGCSAYVLQGGSGSNTVGMFTDNSSGILTFGTNFTERVRIDTSGNLLVGTTSTPSGATGSIVANNASYIGSNKVVKWTKTNSSNNVTTATVVFQTTSSWFTNYISFIVSCVQANSANNFAASYLYQVATLDASGGSTRNVLAQGDNAQFTVTVTGNSGTGTQTWTVSVTGPATANRMILTLEAGSVLGINATA